MRRPEFVLRPVLAVENQKFEDEDEDENDNETDTGVRIGIVAP
jgi:hypothetical protein